MFVDQKKSFNSAQSYCQSKNGRLFEPRSVQTNNLVAEKGHQVLNNNAMWFGIILKNGKSGPWKFATSGENIVQTMWEPGQPNDGSIEICGYYQTGGYGTKWWVVPCSRARRFICEFV